MMGKLRFYRQAQLHTYTKASKNPSNGSWKKSPGQTELRGFGKINNSDKGK
jgi:hypothetical protein